MIRWIRILAIGVLVISLILLGVGVGLFLVVNGGWVALEVPPWLHWAFGQRGLELWLPGLIAGWLLAAFSLAGLLVWSMFWVWRRRQYEGLVRRLEQELTRLRNLPFESPAPLEDLPEAPDAAVARSLAEDESGDDEAGSTEAAGA